MAENNRNPRIYDIVIDEWRDATQDDLNDYMALNRAYGHIRQAAKEAHEELIRSMTVKAN